MTSIPGAFRCPVGTESNEMYLEFRNHLLTEGGYKVEKKRSSTALYISLVDADVKQGQFNI